MARETGVVRVAKLWAAWKVPSPLPNRTGTVPARELATARSGRPSPLTSPMATDRGLVPTAKSARAAMNETVWAGAGLGNADEKNKLAATSSNSLVEFLVISGPLLLKTRGFSPVRALKRHVPLDGHDSLEIR